MRPRPVHALGLALMGSLLVAPMAQAQEPAGRPSPGATASAPGAAPQRSEASRLRALGFAKSPNTVDWSGGTAKLTVRLTLTGEQFTVRGRAPRRVRPGTRISLYRYHVHPRKGHGHASALGVHTRVTKRRTYEVTFDPQVAGTHGYLLRVKGTSARVKFQMRSSAGLGWMKVRNRSNGPGGPETSLTTSIMKWAFDQVSAYGKDKLKGWVMGALFGVAEDPQKQQLELISDQLKQISQQLTEVQAKLAELAQQIDTLNCSIQTSQMVVAVSTIQTITDDYQNVIQRRTADPAVLAKLAEEIIGGPAMIGGQIPLQVTEIDNVLNGLAGQTGAIEACGRKFLDEWKMALDEPTYYQKLTNYLGYFWSVKAQAVLLQNEALHWLAADAVTASGAALPDADSVSDVCDPAGPYMRLDKVSLYCDQALVLARQAWRSISDQAAAVGAGYSLYDGASDVSVERDVVTGRFVDQLWSRSLSGFDILRCWSYTSTPSADPLRPSQCGSSGVIVGTDDGIPYQNRFGVTGWRIASATDWARVMTPTYGKQPTVQAGMEAQGFTPFAEANQRNLIVYTGEKFQTACGIVGWACFELQAYNWGGQRGPNGWYWVRATNLGGLCLLDTASADVDGRAPVCGEQGAQEMLSSETHRSGTGTTRWQSDWTQSQSSDPQYYRATMHSSGGTASPMGEFGLSTGPAGWMFQGSGVATPIVAEDQYRWPVVELPTDRTCSAGPATGLNVNGVPSMCDDDYSAHWLSLWLPAEPPAPTG